MIQSPTSLDIPVSNPIKNPISSRVTFYVNSQPMYVRPDPLVIPHFHQQNRKTINYFDVGSLTIPLIHPPNTPILSENVIQIHPRRDHLLSSLRLCPWTVAVAHC